MLKTSENLFNCSKALWLLPVGVALLNLGVESRPVGAVTFQQTTRGALEFRDYNDRIVGTGTFKYSPTPFEGTFAIAEILTLVTSYDEDGNSYSEYLPTGEQTGLFYNDSSEIPDNLNILQTLKIDPGQDLRLTQISLNFVDLQPTYNLGLFPYDTYFFKPPASSFLPFGNVLSKVTISSDRSGEYFLFSSSDWSYQLDLVGDVQILIAEGGSFYFSDTSSFPKITLLGTWTARAVPEPLTLLGASTASVFGAFFKRKLSTSRNRCLRK